MKTIFEVIDKIGKQVYLSKERYKHIRKKHPEIENLKMIKETIKNPNEIKNYTIAQNNTLLLQIL